MKLTRRQEEFVRSLLELYGELREPFHYSELAERLGVSRFTAYDMLRVLEEKGIVTSQYQLDEDREGPGRSTVMYEPTPQARRILADVFEQEAADDWEAVAERLLEQVLEGQLGDAGLAEEMLARTPVEETPSLRYCVEVMTVVALRLQRQTAREELSRQVQALLSEENEPCRVGLSLLGGVALGVLGERAASEEAWWRELQDHVWQYETLVLAMDPEECRRLAGHLRELFFPLAKR